MAVYSDFQGWQNKQFTGRGEFALTFGDFKVTLTYLPIILWVVPANAPTTRKRLPAHS
jgi:hypothetical protein